MLPAAVMVAAAARVYRNGRVPAPRRAYVGAAVRAADAVLRPWDDTPASMAVTDALSAWLLTLDRPRPEEAASAAAFALAAPALLARPLVAQLPEAHWAFRLAGALLLVYALTVFEAWTSSGLRPRGATETAAARAPAPPTRRT